MVAQSNLLDLQSILNVFFSGEFYVLSALFFVALLVFAARTRMPGVVTGFIFVIFLVQMSIQDSPLGSNTSVLVPNVFLGFTLIIIAFAIVVKLSRATR